MSGNQNVEGVQDNGADGANQSVSTPQAGSINDAEQLSKLLDAKLSEALKPVLAEVRGVQGRQDKDRSAFKEFMDEYKKHKAKGLSDDDAEMAANTSLKEKADRESEKELLRQIATKLGLSSTGTGTPAAASVIESYKLDANDPEVVREVLSLSDPTKAELAALKIVNRRLQQPAPSPAAAGTIQAPPSTPASVESLTKQYQTEMLAAAGNPSRVRALKAEYSKKGVPVDGVVFH